MSSLTKKEAMGCASIVFAVPAVLIWYVLFGLMLYRTDASVAEWSLYVGYMVLHSIGVGTGTILHQFIKD